jgi:alkylation response protein AidB-like acyl-CoA dehydrogenase
MALAEDADQSFNWPSESWNLLSQVEVTGWCIPSVCGGLGLSPIEIMIGYERLAGSCLTSAFILSQRDAAVRRIRDSGRDDLARELLRPLACGGRFATVGISQLTTSRQHGAPALVAEECSDGLVLDGVMPWVTAADQADHIVAGAVLDDGRQVLVVVPSDTPGITVMPPLHLASLCGSRTSEVHCRQVALPRRWLLAGPAPQVMASGRGGTGGLETSCLALGHAGGAIDDLELEAGNRPELHDIAARFSETRQRLCQDLHRLVEDGASSEAAFSLRARANALALRATQAALTASKGAGFVKPHAAQRRARQALFFLVWSCPRPAAEATLRDLSESPMCS